MKHRIFVFCNSCAPRWHVVLAISDEGHFLGSHVCSDHAFIPHDMGFTPDGWKRDTYDKFYPEGWELEFVDAPIREHAGLMEAYTLNLALGEKASEGKPEPETAKVTVTVEHDDGRKEDIVREFGL